ncbi:hypothetical protein GCM10007171_26520 [Dickeya fangzhongdai]|nr:hypothetical protein GCM10007171_26520 [Dickeya fangzhongdai]
MTFQNAFDFTGFHPLAVNLDLRIVAAGQNQVAVGVDHAEVAGAVSAFPVVKGDKATVIPLQIAGTEPGGDNQHLPHDALTERLQLFVDDEQPGIVDRLADRQHGAIHIRGRDRIAHLRQRGFGRAVEIE